MVFKVQYCVTSVEKRGRRLFAIAVIFQNFSPAHRLLHLFFIKMFKMFGKLETTLFSIINKYLYLFVEDSVLFV